MRHLMTLLLALGPGVGHAACPATPQTFMGNSHIPGAAREATDVGEGVIVQGRVMSAGDCKPIGGARIERWQAGWSGSYEPHLRAWMRSAPNGRYRFETEWPNMGRPHIHFIVEAPGYRRLVTMWTGDAPVELIELDLVLEADD